MVLNPYLTVSENTLSRVFEDMKSPREKYLHRLLEIANSHRCHKLIIETDFEKEEDLGKKFWVVQFFPAGSHSFYESRNSILGEVCKEILDSFEGWKKLKEVEND